HPAGHDDRTAMICRILMPRTACLRKTRDIHSYTDDLPCHLPWSHESRDVVHQPWMFCQACDTRVMVRIGKDAVHERYSIGTVPLRDAFQALCKGQLWAARLIWREESARDTIDGLRDASLHLVYLGMGKNPCTDGITTRGNGHGVSPSSFG